MTRATESPSQWQPHPVAAGVIRAFVRLAPLVVALVVSVVSLRTLPAGSTWIGVAARTGIAVIAAWAAAIVVGRLARRLLPLSTMLKLSLVFPDSAPSRFRVALKASSNSHLKKQLKQARNAGLDDDRSRATEQLLVLSEALLRHDRRTRGHSERVRAYVRLIGEQIDLDEVELQKLEWAALLHDIGKLMVPVPILNKPGELDAAEWAILRQHPEAGRELLAPLDTWLGLWASAADSHHERWDGSGYPRGAAGHEIPLAGRIVAVADAFEVMTAARSYKAPMSVGAARTELTQSAGSHFDPGIVRALLAVSVGTLRVGVGPLSFALAIPVLGPLIGKSSAFLGGIFNGPQAGVANVAVAGVSVVAISAGAVAGVVPTIEPSDQRLPFGDESAIVLGDAPATTLNQPTGSTSTALPAENRASENRTSENRTEPADTPDLPPGGTKVSTTTTQSGSEGSTSTTTQASTTTTQPTTTTTQATTTTTQATTTTTQATTTTTQPTTTTTQPTTTTTKPPSDPGVQVDEGNGVIVGYMPNGADLTQHGDFDHDSEIYVFLEGRTSLGSDILIGGELLPAGTSVCSFYIHFTPVTDNFTSDTDLLFDDRIITVAMTNADLDASDFLGNPTVTYKLNRALEHSDEVEVDDGYELSVEFQAGPGGVDNVRVLTACR